MEAALPFPRYTPMQVLWFHVKLGGAAYGKE